MNQNYIFTSESVSDGHPDKVADQISDALADAGLKAGNETTRVAIETLVTTNLVTVAGEVVPFINVDAIPFVGNNLVEEAFLTTTTLYSHLFSSYKRVENWK